MPARLVCDDATFVRSRADTVYALLSNVDSWSLWNPKLRLRRRAAVAPDAAGADNRWIGALNVALARDIRLGMDADGWRHNQGFWVHLSADIDGSSEWWLDTEREGVVVHHLLRVNDPVPGVRRTQRKQADCHEEYRRAMRIVMWGVREHVHHLS